MAALPMPILLHPGIEQDENTRAYLAALSAGRRPPRPDVGPKWLPLAEYVEGIFDGVGPDVRGKIISNYLQNLIKNKKYPGLEELLSIGNRRAGDMSPLSPLSPIAPALADGGFPELPPSAHLPPELSLGASPYMERYISYSKKASPESYEDYHENGYLWLLSTIDAHRTRVPLGPDFFTPLMLVMVSDPSVVKKSTAAKAAKQLLYAAGLDFFLGSGHTTPQKMIHDMVGVLPKNYGSLDKPYQEHLEKRLAFSGQRGIYIDEFGKFVKSILSSNSAMADFQHLLLEMDNCEPIYENATINRGAERIENPYLAVFGSMTPQSIKNSAKSGADFWGDGFWSRFAFSCAPRGTNMDAPFEEEEIPLPWDVIDGLKDWHQRLGLPSVAIEPVLDKKDEHTGEYTSRCVDPLPVNVCKLGPGVRDAWVRYRSALKSIFSSWNIEDLNASYDRLPTRAMRVAALLASLENNGVIELRHWAKAQEIAERWRRSLHELYAQVNTSEMETSYAKKIEIAILDDVKRFQANKKDCTLRELCRAQPKVDSGRIKVAVADLVRAEVLNEDKSGRTAKYTMAGEE